MLKSKTEGYRHKDTVWAGGSERMCKNELRVL